MDFKYNAIENDITFVAQLSYDRLQTIEELIKSWPGIIKNLRCDKCNYSYSKINYKSNCRYYSTISRTHNTLLYDKCCNK